MSLQAGPEYRRQLDRRHRASAVFARVCRLCTWFALSFLVVLLLSVIAGVNHEGGISAFVDGRDATAATVTEVERILRAHPAIRSVERDVDASGSVSFYLTVGEIPDGTRYEDIRRELEETLFEVDGIDLTLDSSEPIVGWDWEFLTRYPSTLYPEQAGILPGIWGSIWLVLLTGTIAVPLGVGAAIYLEEFAASTAVTRVIRLNLANLAGVPSIVYGILGFTVFVRFFGESLTLPGSDTRILPLGKTVLSGALTLALLILPIIIVATQEALRAVPGSIRTASIALGATRWQTIRHQVLPASLPGIATGIILAASRALGETAPIVVIGVLAFTRATPGGIETPMDVVRDPGRLLDVPFDQFATLPIQIYNWVSDSRPEFGALAARGILVLLVVLLCMNSVAVLLRNRYEKKLKW